MKDKMEDKTAMLPYRLERCVSNMTQKLQSDLMESGIELPHSQYAVLRVLYANDGSSQAFISRTLQKDTAAIKRTIDNLEKRGLVMRVQNSGRDYKVFVTDKGLELRNELFRQVEIIRERVFEGVTPQEIDTVLGFIEKVMKNISESENHNI